MSDPITWEVLPNEQAEGEETVSGDELFKDIMEGFEASTAWNAGEGTARITEFVNGERIGPEELTKQELVERQQARSIGGMVTVQIYMSDKLHRYVAVLDDTDLMGVGDTYLEALQDLVRIMTTDPVKMQQSTRRG